MNNSTNYPIASLYVGDLHPEVTEAMLFERFSTAGKCLATLPCEIELFLHRTSVVYQSVS